MNRPKRLFYEITNKSPQNKTVDILIYGSIPAYDEDSWKMKNTAEKFVKDFKALEKDYDRINIHINSPGGSVYHGFPIFNAIASSKKEVHTYNDGLAASMGGVLLLAGKTVHTAKNALLMIHNALAWSIGNAEDMREVADMLEKYDGIIAQHFADKSGKSLEDIQSRFLDYKDHFLTADEAREEGFVDIVEDYESEDAPPADIANMAFGEVMNLYKDKSGKREEQSFFAKVTDHVRKALNFHPKAEEPTETTPAATREDTPQATESTTNNEPMDFKNSLDILNKESLTPEDIAAVKAEISAFTGANEKFTAEEVQARINEAVNPVQAQLDAANAEKAELETKANSLHTTNCSLDAENKNLKLDIAAYRKSGVTIDNVQSQDPDPIEGEETEPSFYSDTDEEVRRLRAQMQ